ncbi:hypothetical protein [Adhaeretor mobilis]|uniref:PEP-CTERM protein-sorting domain-containing protein n=1 Tax=Adhaeretor mobilis TaxID=1930276 RepID=A0A517MX56_9BACT|nr:hypothetical protein [Adhaeretor mobilis]QDS99456.1 hypothetical protein HG15A2_27790 [Adhaeretor mobilis]
MRLRALLLCLVLSFALVSPSRASLLDDQILGHVGAYGGITNIFDPPVAVVGGGVEFSNFLNSGGGPASLWEADFTAGTLTVRLTNVKQTPSSVQNLIWDFRDLDYLNAPQQIVGMSTLVDTFPGGSVASFDNAAPSSPGKNHIRILQTNINGTLITPGEFYEATFSIQTTGVFDTEPGDFDEDGDVDGADFLEWQRNPSVGNLFGWQNNYGMTAPLSAASTAVPEPSTLLLAMLMGTLLLSRQSIAL